MRILHYSLGFPPYRSGGMTRFSYDLMREQSSEGHEVSLLWPGRISMIHRRTGIRRHHDQSGIGSLEVINPAPVAYDEGIKDISLFMQEGEREAYRRFLLELRPEVIHIHTLMGLHKSLLEEAKDLGIRLIFSAHDYYPVCPKVVLFRKGEICDSALSCSDCACCNEGALSKRQILLLQSPLYRGLKETFLIKKLRKGHRDRFFAEYDRKIRNSIREGAADDYLKLRQFYYSMLKLMDMIHYNSTVTKEVYEGFFCLPESRVINITHSGIRDNRRKKDFFSDVMRIRYLGTQSRAKGYYLLIRVMDRLWESGKRFRLDVHFTPSEIPEYLHCHPAYTVDQLEEIFEDTDLLICPSVWKETFGYTVLEALSYGVPVMISENVGAGDILSPGAGIVVSDFSEETLTEALSRLKKEDLMEMNGAILSSQVITTMKSFAGKMQELYSDG